MVVSLVPLFAKETGPRKNRLSSVVTNRMAVIDNNWKLLSFAGKVTVQSLSFTTLSKTRLRLTICFLQNLALQRNLASIWILQVNRSKQVLQARTILKAN